MENRRDFLKKSAMIGGAVWAAPAIATVSSALATGSGLCPSCVKSAYGLSASGLVNISQQGVAGSGNECVANINQSNVLNTVSIVVQSVCGHTSSTSCEAQACVADVVITIGSGTSAAVLTVTSLQTCVSEDASCNQCAAVNGLVTLNGNTVGPGPFTCDQVLFPGNGLLTIIANQQVCNSDGTRTVNGLYINALSSTETVILASATAGACRGCSCTTCASCTTCLQCNTTCTHGSCTA